MGRVGGALFPTLPQSSEGPNAVELFIRHTLGPYHCTPIRPRPRSHASTHEAAKCTLPPCGGMQGLLGLHPEAASVWGSQGLVGVCCSREIDRVGTPQTIQICEQVSQVCWPAPNSL